MSKRKWWIVILVFILAGYVLLQFVPYAKKQKTSYFYGDDNVKVIAHGGAKAMYPENTVYAFEQVMKYPVDILEVDLHLSKDNYLVGVHDDNIDAYTKFKGEVCKYTYKQLKQMNFGYHFKNIEGEYAYRDVSKKTLNKLVPIEAEQLLKMYKKEVLYIFEIKDRGERGKKAVKILNSIVKDLGLEKQVCICAFDKEVMQYCLKMKAKGITTIMDYKSSEDFVISNYYGYDAFLDFSFEGMMLPKEEKNVQLENRYLIWKAHKNNKFVYYWTIDNKEEMKKLIEYGADGIISDRIDVLVEVLKEQDE